jgi:hypothetical protein
MSPSQTRLLWRAKLPLGYLLYILCVFKSKTIREKKAQISATNEKFKKVPGFFKKGRMSAMLSSVDCGFVLGASRGRRRVVVESRSFERWN